MNLRFVALSLAMIIPASSGVLYWTLGNPAAMTHPAASAASQGGPGGDGQMAEGLNQLIEQLRKIRAESERWSRMGTACPILYGNGAVRGCSADF